MTTASKWRLFVIAGLFVSAVLSLVFAGVAYAFSGDAFQPRITATYVPVALACLCGLGGIALVVVQEREDNE